MTYVNSLLYYNFLAEVDVGYILFLIINCKNASSQN